MDELRLLGPVCIEYRGSKVSGLRSRKALALLAYVAAQDQMLPRARLADLFWPDDPTVRSHANLRWVLNHLGRVLPGCLVVQRYSVVWGEALRCDLHDFSARLRQNTVAALSVAADLYQGEFMADFTLDSCPEFEHWLVGERERWLQQVSHLFSTLTTHFRVDHNYHMAIVYAQRWLQVVPWQEEAHRYLMHLFVVTGQRSMALQQYAICCQVLTEELGVAPEPQTMELYQQIYNGQNSSRWLGTQSSPLKQATYIPLSRCHNLPRPLTPLIGRERELTQIEARLMDGACAWVTLLGPGGIGKTRLAVAVAERQLLRFADGVWFIPLVGIESVERLPLAIAQTLGLSWLSTDELKLHLLNYLRTKQLLLVLDNFEHLLDGVTLIGDIIQQAPAVKMLVTSRERLRHQAEWVVDIGGLAVPPETMDASMDADSIGAYSAVQLFIQSASRIQATFALTATDATLVSRICRLVGGMPLGIELAAAWGRTLPWTTIYAALYHNLDFASPTLHGLPDRHRTLRAVIDSSWRRLTVREQIVLTKLTVFRNEFRLEAAEQVAGATADILTALIDKSLLTYDGTGWYSLHELVRQFGAEQLQCSGLLSATYTAHSFYYANFIAQQAAALISPKPQPVLQLFDRELDNVRSAWQWAVQTGHTSIIMAATQGLYLYFDHRTLLYEARQVFQQAAEALTFANPLPEHEIARAKVLACYGLCLFRYGEAEQAAQVLEESLAIATRYNLTTDKAYALYVLGYNSSGLGHDRQAEAYLLAALTLAEASADRLIMVKTLYALGWYYSDHHQPEASFDALRRALALARELGDLRSVAHILYYLGNCNYTIQAYDQARQHFQASLTIFRELGIQWGIAQAKAGLLHIAYTLVDYIEAKQLCEAVIPIYEKMGAHAHTLTKIQRIYAEVKAL